MIPAEHGRCQKISNEEVSQGGSTGDQGECSAGRECQINAEQRGAGVRKEKPARKGKRIQEAHKVPGEFNEVQRVGFQYGKSRIMVEINKSS